MRMCYVMLAVLMLLCQNAKGQATPKIENSNVVALSTNFILPFARFNFNETSNKEAVGNLKLFQSIGAGVSLNYGRLTTTSEKGSMNDAVDERFANAIGLQLGFLFSADLSNEKPSNVFAPTIALNILDFSVGWGVELGTRTEGETGHFMTIAYAIPLQKLTKKGTWKLIKWIPDDGAIMIN